MKRIFIFCLAAALSLGLFGCGSDALKVATNAAFEPFETLDKDGKCVGFDMDLITAIADKMNRKVEFEHMEFSGVLASVASGSHEIAISGLSITEKRKENVDFSDPYYQTTQKLIVKKGDTNFTGTTAEELAKQLEGKTIGFCEGFTGVNYIEGDEDMELPGIKDATTKKYKNISLAIADLKNGAVDAIVMDATPAERACAVAENKNDVQVLNVALTTEYYAIAVKKGDAELLKSINEHLKELKDSGELDKIYDKWELEKE